MTTFRGEVTDLGPYELFLWSVVNALELDYDDWSYDTLGHYIMADFERHLIDAGQYCKTMEECVEDVALTYLAALAEGERTIA